MTLFSPKPINLTGGCLFRIYYIKNIHSLERVFKEMPVGQHFELRFKSIYDRSSAESFLRLNKYFWNSTFSFEMIDELTLEGFKHAQVI